MEIYQTGEKLRELMAELGREEAIPGGAAGGHEAWARLRELLERGGKIAKRMDKTHGDLWNAVVAGNGDELRIELDAMAQDARRLCVLWATVAAEAERDAEEV